MQENIDFVGKQLGQYRLTRMLAKGGYAKVYLGEHVSLGRKCAVKVLHSVVLSPEEHDKFLQEARIVASLIHPNVIRVLEFNTEKRLGPQGGDIPYLVMTWAEQGSLQDMYRHLKGTPLPSKEIVTYIKQIAAALQYAHDNNVVHLDVKPANMLVDGMGDILLSDFGIAVASHKTTPFLSPQAGPESKIFGTVSYIAPERLRGGKSRSSDQYSLAVVAYEWLTGTLPFVGDNNAVMVQHMTQTPLPLRDHQPTIAQEVEAVVMKALSKETNERYPSVKEFANAFEEAMQVQLAQQKAIQLQLAQQKAQQPQPTPLPAQPFVSPQPTPLPAQPFVSPQPTPLPAQPFVSPQPTPLPAQPFVSPQQIPNQQKQWMQQGNMAFRGSTQGPYASRTVANNIQRQNTLGRATSKQKRNMFMRIVYYLSRRDKQFATMPEYRRYRIINYIMILFCTLGFFIILHPYWVYSFLSLLCLPLMLFIFRKSIQFVTPWVAWSGCTIISVYYAAFFWILTSNINLLLPPQVQQQLPPFLIAIGAFAISACFNTLYTSRRVPQSQ